MTDEARGVVPLFPREDQPELVQFYAHWAARRMPTFDGSVPWGKCYCVGFHKDTRLLAVAVYHDYRGHDIQLSGAAESRLWATPPAIRMLLWYPFHVLKTRRLTTITARKNKRARRFDEGIGFRLEGTIRKGYDGKDDAMVYGMLREEAWRWLDDMKEGSGNRQA